MFSSRSPSRLSSNSRSPQMPTGNSEIPTDEAWFCQHIVNKNSHVYFPTSTNEWPCGKCIKQYHNNILISFLPRRPTPQNRLPSWGRLQATPYLAFPYRPNHNAPFRPLE